MQLQELDEMKRRLKEMEEEAAALSEMQAKVAKEMQGVDPNATTSETKEEMDARSVFIGNIIFSSDFRNAFMKVKSAQLRKEVLQKLVGLGCGWRSRVKNLGMTDKFDVAKVYKVNDLYLVWSTDLDKGGRLIQILRIWDLVTSQHIERSIQRLQNLFSLYTDDYVEHCKRIHKEGKWEVPMVWRVGHDVTHFKKDCRVNAQEDHEHVDASYLMDQSKVSESFLLMKFYCLSSGVAKHLLTATDGSEIDIPFKLTEEVEIIRIPHSSFILGRSGTGKTTVLSMKLIQREQQSLIANQGLNFDKVDFSGSDGNHLMTLKDVRAEGSFVKQIFLTVSPKLCSAVKNQISRLKRFSTILPAVTKFRSEPAYTEFMRQWQVNVYFSLSHN